jgi:hypothetical protein
MIRSFAARAVNSAWLALLAATFVVGFQMASKPPRPIYADELQYLTVSRNLTLHGVFSDETVTDQVPGPSAFFAPVAPWLYAVLLKVDTSLEPTIACQFRHYRDPRAHCEIRYSLLTRGIMATLAALGLWGSWVLARSFGLSAVGSWTVLAVVAASGVHAHFARHFLTEAPLLAIFPFFLALLLRATDPSVQRSLGLLVGLGLAMGLLALTRPSYVYQAYAVIMAMPLLRYYRGAAAIGPFGVGAALAVAAGYMLCVVPWMLRNWFALGEFALTVGYDVDILVQRLLYNQMSWAEWWRAWIYWLPDFGDNIAISLFGEDAVRKLSLLEPTGYHYAGNPPIADFLQTHIGNRPATLGNLLPVLLADWPKHVAVSFVMAWQGLWAGKYITFVAVLLAPFALRRMAATGQLRGFLVIAGVVLMMVGFYAFVSVSIPRYNLPMIWISALIAAALVEAVTHRFFGNRTSGIEEQTA